jgi:hypothetical protein
LISPNPFRKELLRADRDRQTRLRFLVRQPRRRHHGRHVARRPTVCQLELRLLANLPLNMNARDLALEGNPALNVCGVKTGSGFSRLRLRLGSG